MPRNANPAYYYGRLFPKETGSYKPSKVNPVTFRPPFLIPSQEWVKFPVESLEDIRDAEPVDNAVDNPDDDDAVDETTPPDQIQWDITNAEYVRMVFGDPEPEDDDAPL